MKKLLLFLLLIPYLSNAITPIFTCGFEEGVTTANPHWNSISGAFSTTTVRTGERSMRQNLTAGQGAFQYNAFASSSIYVFRFYVRFTTLPNAKTTLGYMNTGAVTPGAFFNNVDSKIYPGTFTFSGSVTALGADGISVTTGVWYCVDVKVNVTSNPWTIDVQVDGVATTQFAPALAGTTATTMAIGVGGNNSTADVFFDDVTLSQTSGDYPIGPGYVGCYIPTSDGTHNVAGAKDFEIGTGGVDITNATTTAWQLLDDLPIQSGAPGTTDFVNIVAPPSNSDYVRCMFGKSTNTPTATDAPRFLSIIATYAQSATGLGDLQIKIGDDVVGTIVNVLNSAQVAGVTTIANAAATAAYSRALSTWQVTYVQMGTVAGTNDANPDQYVCSALIEADFLTVNNTVPGTPSDKRHTTLGVGMTAFNNPLHKFNSNEKTFNHVVYYNNSTLWLPERRKRIK